MVQHQCEFILVGTQFHSRKLSMWLAVGQWFYPNAHPVIEGSYSLLLQNSVVTLDVGEICTCSLLYY